MAESIEEPVNGDPDDLILLGRAPGVFEADAVRALLAEDGIPVFLDRESIIRLYGGNPPVRLRVRRQDRERALGYLLEDGIVLNEAGLLVPAPEEPPGGGAAAAADAAPGPGRDEGDAGFLRDLAGGAFHPLGILFFLLLAGAAMLVLRSC